jgi:hypothetical protein
MGATQTRRKQSPSIPQDELDRSLAVIAARKDFLGSSLNMGWQLAFSVLVPVIIGVKLDDRFNTSPSYTLAALILAACGAGMVIWNTLKQTEVKQSKRGKR